MFSHLGETFFLQGGLKSISLEKMVFVGEKLKKRHVSSWTSNSDLNYFFCVQIFPFHFSKLQDISTLLLDKGNTGIMRCFSGDFFFVFFRFVFQFFIGMTELLFSS